jgi:hypothetical protein
LPEAAAGTRGAIEISFMALTLVPVLKKGERLERSFLQVTFGHERIQQFHDQH